MHNPFACHSKNDENATLEIRKVMSHIIFFWTGSFGNEEVHKIGENVVQDKVEDNAQFRVICVV